MDATERKTTWHEPVEEPTIIHNTAHEESIGLDDVWSMREQRLFEVKPFCLCFIFVSHQNGGSTNLHQVLFEKRIQGCRNFLDVANSLPGCRHQEPKTFEWYNRFKEDREETADNERSGRPSTSTMSEKWTRCWNCDNRQPRIAEEGHYWSETWIYGFDSETTQQASEWCFKNEHIPKKARKAPSKVKVMLTVFFDYQGSIILYEFQQQGSTITADSYLGVLRLLSEAIRQKRPELWRSKSWILHHDNALAHTALKVPAGPLNLCVPPNPLQSRFGPLRLLPFGIKLLKLETFDGVCRGRVELING
ncbi:CLCN3 [Cordylochernes scorpioides]|uniref:CLCN3 n=1 Tax=Cordylochernes scorpioides TaxID=51811 RepID=A0ABY6LA99_9ARAC|nr:CLCN3 [Cordylochernes scorpioides]